MRKKFLALAIVLIIAFGVVFPHPYIVKADEVVTIGDLTVHFIDVGQGDACIVELPDNRTMLIDAGENRVAVRNKLDEYITTNIKDEEGNVIEYFDYVIMTHSDSDHIGSMAYILEQYHVKTFYRPNQQCVYNDCVDHALSGKEERNRFWGEAHGTKSKATYHNALISAYENSDEVIVTNPYDDSQNKITSTNDKKYEINFYSPIKPDYSDHNDYSPIMVIEYMGRKIVLTGDAEEANEKDFVKAAAAGEGRYAVFKDFCADVIKLGHHGSHTSSSEDYLNTVTKSGRRSGIFVVISCGEGNQYKHPRPEVLERLSNLGFSDENILRTDKLGDIVISVVEVDGEYMVVHGETAGGSTPSTGSSAGGQEPQDLLSILLQKFDALDFYVKIAIIIAIIVIIILVLVAVSKSKKNKHRRKR